MTTGSPRRQCFKPYPNIGSCGESWTETLLFQRREWLCSDTLGLTGFLTGQQNSHPWNTQWSWQLTLHYTSQGYPLVIPDWLWKDMQGNEHVEDQMQFQLWCIMFQLLQYVLALRYNQYLLILFHYCSGVFQTRFIGPSATVHHCKRFKTLLPKIFTDWTSVAHPVQIWIKEVVCVFMLEPSGTNTLPHTDITSKPTVTDPRKKYDFKSHKRHFQRDCSNIKNKHNKTD